MRATISLGPDPRNRTEVEVDGYDDNGIPCNICKRCGQKTWSGQYYEVGCPCEYKDEAGL